MDDALEKAEQQAPSVVCIGCARPMPEEADFCPHCGAPNGPYCWWDPWKRVFASGHVYRRMTGGPISRFVAGVVLAWIVLNVMVLIYMGYEMTHEPVPRWSGGFSHLLFLLALVAVLVIFLRRVLLNCMRPHH